MVAGGVGVATGSDVGGAVAVEVGMGVATGEVDGPAQAVSIAMVSSTISLAPDPVRELRW
jgi:hypothetical protein